MGTGVLIGFIIIISLLIISVYLFNILWKKGKTRTGIAVGGVIFIFCLYVLNINTVDAFMHSKKDVIKDLSLVKIEIKEDFEILENEVIGMPERIQKTKINLSKSDKDRIILEIKNSPDFFTSNESNLLRTEAWDGKNNKIVTRNYEFNEKYIRESYYRENNFVPIITIIEFNEQNEIIRYERIED
jgi:hypothetical protein